MTHSFLLSLSDCNLDRSLFRSFDDLHRDLDWRTGANYLQRIKDMLPRIPAIERDVVELYYVYGKKQDVIARMLGLSQQAVSHRLHSAYRRITFMLEQPDVSPEQMHRDLAHLIVNPFTVRVLCDFAETSSQTVTAKRLTVPQQRICWHLTAGLKALRESTAMDAVFYVKYFEDLREHRNILREVPAGRRKKRGFDGDTHRYTRYARGPATSYGSGGGSHGAGGEGAGGEAVADRATAASPPRRRVADR